MSCTNECLDLGLDYAPSSGDFATVRFALSAPLSLSLNLCGCSYPRRSHHCYLFAFSTSHHRCSGKVVQWQIDQPRLDRRLTNRFLLWPLSHVLGRGYPIGDLSWSTDFQPRSECPSRLFCLHHSYPNTGQDHEVLIPDPAKAMEWTDKRAKLLQELLLGGMTPINFFCLGGSYPEACSWIQETCNEVN